MGTVPTSLLKELRRNAYLMTGSREAGDAWIVAAFARSTKALIVPDQVAALQQLYQARRKILRILPSDANGDLAALPYFNRAAVILVSVQGFSLGKASIILQLPPEAVRELDVVGRSLLRSEQPSHPVDASPSSAPPRLPRSA